MRWVGCFFEKPKSTNGIMIYDLDGVYHKINGCKYKNLNKKEKKFIK